MSSATEEKVVTWERIHRLAETPAQRKEVEEMAASAGEETESLCGFMRSTYASE